MTNKKSIRQTARIIKQFKIVALIQQLKKNNTHDFPKTFRDKSI